MNPRYVAYARAHGNDPEVQLIADRERWPGGVMCGFMLWISERWSAWHATRKLRRYAHILTAADHADFDVFIGAA